MEKLDSIQLDKKLLAMRVRTKLRLKSQEQYVRDLNEVLPAAEAEFDNQLGLNKRPSIAKIAERAGE